MLPEQVFKTALQRYNLRNIKSTCFHFTIQLSPENLQSNFRIVFCSPREPLPVIRNPSLSAVSAPGELILVAGSLI